MTDNYNFGLAEINRADEILAFYRSLALKPGSTWSRDYPNMGNILADIASCSLYCLTQRGTGRIVSVGAAGPIEDLSNLGVDWMSEAENPCALSRFGVADTLQGQGFGSWFLKAIITHTAQRGFDGIRLIVGSDNTAAVALYRKLGFNFIDEVEAHGIHFYCCSLDFSQAGIWNGELVHSPTEARRRSNKPSGQTGLPAILGNGSSTILSTL